VQCSAVKGEIPPRDDGASVILTLTRLYWVPDPSRIAEFTEFTEFTEEGCMKPIISFSLLEEDPFFSALLGLKLSIWVKHFGGHVESKLMLHSVPRREEKKGSSPGWRSK
jgi:hypothetical protein